MLTLRILFSLLFSFQNFSIEHLKTCSAEDNFVTINMLQTLLLDKSQYYLSRDWNAFKIQEEKSSLPDTEKLRRKIFYTRLRACFEARFIFEEVIKKTPKTFKENPKEKKILKKAVSILTKAFNATELELQSQEELIFNIDLETEDPPIQKNSDYQTLKNNVFESIDKVSAHPLNDFFNDFFQNSGELQALLELMAFTLEPFVGLLEAELNQF